MEVYLELFLLDNFLMDALIVSIAGALCGKRQRAWGSVLAALLGAAFAAVSVAAGGIFASWAMKVLVSIAMIALAFRFRTPREALMCALCFYAASAVTGGIVFALLSLLGGAFENGMLVLPDTLRPALLSLVVAALLPRVLRRFVAKRRLHTHATLRIHWPQRTETVRALIDTGNGLCEPISGMSVIILSQAKMPPVEEGKGRAVIYTSIGGEGVLWAGRPKRIELETENGWYELPPAYAAASPQALKEVDAIVSAAYLAQTMHQPMDKTILLKDINSENAEG